MVHPWHVAESMVARVQVADVRIPAIAFWYNQGYTFNMKTAISIPDRVFREAERAAKRQKVSRSRIYTQAVEAYLKALPKSRQPKE